MRKAVAAAAALTAGTTGSAAVAAWAGIPPRDLLVVLALAAGGALAVAAIGLAGQSWLRRRGAGSATQGALTAGVTAAAVLAALGAVAEGMLLDAHDLAVVLATLPVAAGAGITYAILSASRAASDLERLAAAAARLGDGDRAGLARLTGPAGTAEVAQVAAALAAASDRLDEARARERAMEAGRRDLIAWASHDLRTPLTSLRAVAEALADGVVTGEAERRRYLAALSTHVDRLTLLVDDLFELSRIEAGGFALQLEPTYLPDLVADVLDRFGPGAEAEGVLLVAELPERPLPVLAERDSIGRVLANLVANGLRSTGPGGRLVIAAADTQGTATVSVTDHCGGIPEADLERVFDRMWRGDPARSSGGGGLGLAIARGLVEAHGGTIVAANVDGGCRFTFSLPHAPDAAPARPAAQRP
jgi:signal transduction histidine kinase